MTLKNTLIGAVITAICLFLIFSFFYGTIKVPEWGQSARFLFILLSCFGGATYAITSNDD